MREVPALARTGAFLLLLPSVVGLLALYAGPQDWRIPARLILHAWSAVVLAMAGGCWWGFAAGAPAAERRGGLGWVWFAGLTLTFGALTCLLGPSLQFFQSEAALVMLGGAHLISTGVDARLGPLAPRWWLALRLALAAGTGGASFAAALS